MAQLSFHLPFTDLGAGVVSLVPASSIGSATPTFTRASTAYTVLANQLFAQVASGQPRSYYDHLTGSYLGFLSEPPRTNYCLWSNDITNAVWTKTNLTTALSTGPDGVANSATRVTATTANGSFVQALTIGAAQYTYSIWIRRVTGAGSVSLSINNGANFLGAYTPTSQWKQIKISATNPTGVGLRINTTGDSFDVWCSQLENGGTDTATSPIPTTAATASRAGDSLRYLVSGNTSGANGTAFAEVFQLQNNIVNASYVVGSWDRGPLNFRSQSVLISNDWGSIDTGVNIGVGVSKRIAARWGSGVKNITVEGVVTPSAYAYSGTYFNTAQSPSFCIGGTINGNSQCGAPIKNFRLYDAPLLDDQVITLTTTGDVVLPLPLQFATLSYQQKKRRRG